MDVNSSRIPDSLCARPIRFALSHLMPALTMLLMLSACGGGGGGGGSPPPPIPAGSFTLSAHSAAFTALQSGAVPAAQAFDINIQGSGAAFVGAAYPSGQSQPPWLTVGITGSGSHYQLAVGIVPGAVVAGQYSTTFAVGTADGSGNILSHQDFTVTLTENAHLAATSQAATQSLIFGDTTTTQTVPLSVTAPGRQWTAASDSTWLHVVTTPQSGSTTFNATVDDSGLAPGTYQGTLRFLSTLESDDTATVAVSLTVTPAALTIVESSYSFGGNDGRGPFAADPMTFSLSTGTGIYPYAISVTTDSGGAWLGVSPATGTVGSAGSTANLTVNTASLHGGTYTGRVHLATTVNGVTFTQDRPVILNLEANRLVVTAAGVGLSEVAGRSVLSRTVKVLSAIGRTTPWTAASDNSWLTVTSSGVTGGDLTVTANPSGLPLDSTQFANVTITSSDPTVENQAAIRVGFIASNTAPVTGSITVTANRLATSPVEPIVAIGAGSTDIGIYDVYSHALLRTLPNVVATSDGLSFSEDGKTLFVYDTTNFRVVEVDAVTGVRKATYDSAAGAGGGVGTALQVLHPNGWATLVTPAARIYDLIGGAELAASTLTTLQLTSFAAVHGLTSSPDQSLLATQDGITAGIVRSALAGGSLVIQPNPVIVSTAQGRQGEACFSASGDRIYTASGAPYDFPATSVATSQVIQTLAGTNYPDSMQCVWNGLVIGGVDGYYAPDDIFVYYGPTGVSLGQFSSNGSTSAYRDLLNRGMAVSADGTRLISAWTGSLGNSSAPGVYFQTLPPPPP
jgi:Viral BACON domain